jgi:hypothetical protein
MTASSAMRTNSNSFSEEMNVKIDLTEAAWVAVQRALEVAAEQYDRDAHTASCEPGQERVEQAFKDQAKLARELAERIDERLYA